MPANVQRPSLRVASVQMESLPFDKEANFVKIEGFARRGAREGAKLVVFPECCITGYWFMRNLTAAELEGMAEAVPEGPSAKRLSGLAKELGISIGAGLVERAADGSLYNTYLVALSDGRVHRHRKLHAFEHNMMCSGNEYTVFDLPEGFRAGILICYDCNIIENARITTLMGAEVLIAPHQTGAVRSKNPHLMGVIDREIWDRRKEDPAAIEKEFRGEKGRGWLTRWLPARAHDIMHR